METSSLVIIFIFIFIIYFIVNESITNNYAKSEESFDEFVKSFLMRFEYENSPLHTIVCGGTGTGKTYFVRQYLKLYGPPSEGLSPYVFRENEIMTGTMTENMTGFMTGTMPEPRTKPKYQHFDVVLR